MTSTARSTEGVGIHAGPRWAMIGAGAALIGTCYGLARFAYGLFLPEFSDAFSISSSVSGLIGAGSYAGYCVAIVVSLALTSRWGPRNVAVLAGLFATAGLSIVAVATSAEILAVGILLAGSSTGIASPPLAAAINAWVSAEVRDRGQTMTNAGTGLGVLISGPVALVLLDRWRWAWAGFALIAAVVTWWVHRAIPAGVIPARIIPSEVIPARVIPGEQDRRSSAGEDGAARSDGQPGPKGARLRFTTGTWRLLAGSFAGLGSITVWGFGRDLLTSQAGVGTLGAAVVWTILGAAGILGALGGDVVRRMGLRAAWVALMLTMGSSTALFALVPTSPPVVFSAAALFGASYIGLTGVALLWSARLYPARPSYGVGLSFFTIAAGQAAGSPLVGGLVQPVGVRVVFFIWAGLAILGMTLGPRAHHWVAPPDSSLSLPTNSPGVQPPI